MTPKPRPDSTTTPEAPELPEGLKPLAAVLQELAHVLPGLKAALERQARPPVERLAFRLDEIADRYGNVSTRD